MQSISHAKCLNDLIVTYSIPKWATNQRRAFKQIRRGNQERESGEGDDSELVGYFRNSSEIGECTIFSLKIVCRAAESQELLSHTEDMNLAFGELILPIPLNLEDILPHPLPDNRCCKRWAMISPD